MTCPLKTIASAGRNRPRADRGELIVQSRLGARPSIDEHVRVFTRTRDNVLLWVFRPSP